MKSLANHPMAISWQSWDLNPKYSGLRCQPLSAAVLSSEDHLVARRPQAGGYYGNQAAVGSEESGVQAATGWLQVGYPATPLTLEAAGYSVCPGGV